MFKQQIRLFGYMYKTLNIRYFYAVIDLFWKRCIKTKKIKCYIIMRKHCWVYWTSGRLSWIGGPNYPCWSCPVYGVGYVTEAYTVRTARTSGLVLSTTCIAWKLVVFRPRFCTVKTILGRGKPGLMKLFFLRIRSQVQDWLLDLLICRDRSVVL